MQVTFERGRRRKGGSNRGNRTGHHTHEINFYILIYKKIYFANFYRCRIEETEQREYSWSPWENFQSRTARKQQFWEESSRPSVCHQCPLKALGGAGQRWHPETVYFVMSLKLSERGLWGSHFIKQPSGALQSAGCWPPGGERSVNNCDCSVPCLVFWGITGTLFLETAPEVTEALSVQFWFPPWVQIKASQKVGHWPSRWTHLRLDGARSQPWGVSV